MSSSNTATVTSKNKRLVAKRACLACRTKKIKCDGEVAVFKEGNTKCTNCKEARIDKCEFVPSKRGGRKPRKALSLEEDLKREAAKKQKNEMIKANSEQAKTKKRKLEESDVDLNLNSEKTKTSKVGIMPKWKQTRLSVNVDSSSEKIEFPPYMPLRAGSNMEFLPVNDPLDKNAVSQFSSDMNSSRVHASIVQSAKGNHLPSLADVSGSIPFSFFESKPASPNSSVLNPIENTNAIPFPGGIRADHERMPSLQSRHNSLFQLNPHFLKPNSNFKPAQHSRKPSYFSNTLTTPQFNLQQLNSNINSKEKQESPKSNTHTHSKSLSRLLNDIFPKPPVIEDADASLLAKRSIPSDTEKNFPTYGFPQPQAPDILHHQHQSSFLEPQLLRNNEKPIVSDNEFKVQRNRDNSIETVDKSSKNLESSGSENYQHTRNSSGYWSLPYPGYISPQPNLYHPSGITPGYLFMNQNPNIVTAGAIPSAAPIPFQKTQDTTNKDEAKREDSNITETPISNYPTYYNTALPNGLVMVPNYIPPETLKDLPKEESDTNLGNKGPRQNK